MTLWVLWYYIQGWHGASCVNDKKVLLYYCQQHSVLLNHQIGKVILLKFSSLTTLGAASDEISSTWHFNDCESPSVRPIHSLEQIYSSLCLQMSWHLMVPGHQLASWWLQLYIWFSESFFSYERLWIFPFVSIIHVYIGCHISPMELWLSWFNRCAIRSLSISLPTGALFYVGSAFPHHINRNKYCSWVYEIGW